MVGLKTCQHTFNLYHAKRAICKPKKYPLPSSSSPPQPTKAFKHEHRADLSRGVKCQGRRNYGDDNSNSFGATFDGQRSAHGSARRESWRFEVGA